jgi:hypothetical protein
MSEISIGLDVVEAATRAVQEVRTEPRRSFYTRTAEAAISAALDKLGATVERRGEFQRDPKRKGIKTYVETEERLVMDWRPVDAESTDCVVCHGADPDCGVCTQVQVDRHRGDRVDSEPSEPSVVLTNDELWCLLYDLGGPAGMAWPPPQGTVTVENRRAYQAKLVAALPSATSERRSGQVRRSEANTPRSEMLPQRRSGSGRRREDAESCITHVRSAEQQLEQRLREPEKRSERIRTVMADWAHEQELRRSADQRVVELERERDSLLDQA